MGRPPITKRNQELLDHWVPRWTIKKNAEHLEITVQKASTLADNHGLLYKERE